MKKIKIDRDPRDRDAEPHDSAEPFCYSSRRSMLVHRTRYVSTYLIRGKKSHDVATAWCMASFSQPILTDDPAAGLLLCTRCESLATEHELPTSASLAGRHICLGRLVIENVCPTHRKKKSRKHRKARS